MCKRHIEVLSLQAPRRGSSGGGARATVACELRAAGRSRPPALTSLITMITLVLFPLPIEPLCDTRPLPPVHIISVLDLIALCMYWILNAKEYRDRSTLKLKAFFYKQVYV